MLCAYGPSRRIILFPRQSDVRMRCMDRARCAACRGEVCARWRSAENRCIQRARLSDSPRCSTTPSSWYRALCCGPPSDGGSQKPPTSSTNGNDTQPSILRSRPLSSCTVCNSNAILLWRRAHTVSHNLDPNPNPNPPPSPTCSKRFRCAVSSGGADRTAYRLVAGRCAAAAAAAPALLLRSALGRRKPAPR